MNFSEEEIRRLSEWHCPAELPPPLPMSDILEGLSKNLDSAVSIRQLDSADSGLSNYNSFFISIGENQQGKCEGILLYASALSPIFAMSEATIYFASGAYSYSGIEPDQLLELKALPPLASAISVLLLQRGYQLITKTEALTPLPSGVLPHEYCLNKEPWNKVFHVLFANAD